MLSSIFHNSNSRFCTVNPLNLWSYLALMSLDSFEGCLFSMLEHPLDVGGRISAGRALERDERAGLQGLVDEGVVESWRSVCELDTVSSKAGFFSRCQAGLSYLPVGARPRPASR